MTEFSGSGSLDQGLNQGANPGSPPTGGGDMYRSTYDTNNDGVVDDSERLGGQLPAYYATATDLATALAAAVAAQAAITAHAALTNNPHSTTLEQARSAANAILGIIRGSGLHTNNALDLNNSDYGTPGSVLKSSNAVVVVQDGRILITDNASFAGIVIDTVALTAQMFNDYGSFTLNADGTLDAGNNRILNLATPTQTSDAVTKSYADALIVGLEATANKNQNNGYAGLDNNGLIPSTLLPSYVDDILEFANLAAFPATGESGKVYTALDTFKIYRWSGSFYVEISPSPGSSDDVPEGSVNKYFQESRVLSTVLAGLSLATNAVISAADSVLSALGKLQAQITANLATLTSHTGNTSNPHSVTAAQVGLGNVNNTADSDKPVSTAQQTAINASVNKLRSYNYTSYTLPSSTSELVTHSIEVNGGVYANDILEVYSSCVTNNSAGTKNFKMYIHNAPGTPGSAPPAGTLIATGNTITTSTGNPLSRSFPVLSTTSIRAHGGTTGTFGSQYGASAVTSATVTVPDLSSTFYIIITAQKSTAGDTATTDYTYVKIHKA